MTPNTNAPSTGHAAGAADLSQQMNEKGPFERAMFDYGWRDFSGRFEGEPRCWYYDKTELQARWFGWHMRASHAAAELVAASTPTGRADTRLAAILQEIDYAKHHGWPVECWVRLENMAQAARASLPPAGVSAAQSKEEAAGERTDAKHAAWLADKIVALGDYAKEAAAMLRRWPIPAGVQEATAANRGQTE